MNLLDLSEDEARFLQRFRELGPVDRKAAIQAGRALLALIEARTLACEAAALAPHWGPFLAGCMREDADRIAPPPS